MPSTAALASHYHHRSYLCIMAARRSVHSTVAMSSASTRKQKQQQHQDAELQPRWAVQRMFDQPPTATGALLTQWGRRALAHFDQIYGPEFGPELWPSIRLALLSQPRHVAVLNRFYVNQAAAETRLLTLGAEDLAPDWRRRLQAWPESAEESFESPAAGQPHQLSERSAELKVLSYDRLEAATFAASSAAAADSRSNLNEFLPATEFITEMDPRGRASLALSDSAVHGGPTDDSCSLIDPADPELWLPSDLTISPTLQVFAFPSSVQHQLMKPAGSDRWFPRPKPDQTTGLCPYLPMDLGSVAAALALCPGDGDSVLDLCSAPGSKAYCLLQQALPGQMLCLDKSSARSSRLARLLSSHVPPSVLAGCSVSQLYANALNSGAYPLNSFDRVLVDPTCSGDRHSLNDPEADLFSGRRSKERVGLPNTQLQLLLAGAAACRPGASLVYSTCTMSPAQNEAVVLSALAKLQPAFKLVDLRPLASLLVGAGCRVESRQVGLLVLPHLLANYGPSFVCKLKRVD
ncbi:hypothetical protein BOX15_Mlig012351g1 [Macrostomum lignano]|uniref:NOL1/NOP2/Sun domain family member 4 n=1 Tax=Macrostomum lignano TaxID=282301 RepID=A0A267EPQ1_9PLAT|nr:hypothetical protein BOX15_Mlig012351g1 [Macrostomum lignano]